MNFQIGLSAGLIGKIYYKMGELYNTQEYIIISIKNIYPILKEDPIFYKEYYSLLYEYEKILMTSYFENGNIQEAQKSLNMIKSYCNSNHKSDLDLYQAIIYSYSGNIQRVFIILKKLEISKLNIEQISKCNKCFEVLIDNHRGEFINYIQTSKLAKGIIIQITKNNNITNWINSQILASENRKLKKAPNFLLS
ncbi:hypothetical protein LY90DRAFT_503549 [Neocallimastix californiae]|uniref:Uncharacterized protein n=1 Tax=Neocallimastix californiae TaxID=1754190 RepID=A0A1Y2EMT8_9FUNG|nr:hypothetical protein LY90DRAFT_503549 [Neocallimastix californiae]|eukprot:ORY72868.1 hypothetical protein LY90DRAFT_503549 [Neocallimastix californiae]